MSGVWIPGVTPMRTLTPVEQAHEQLVEVRADLERLKARLAKQDEEIEALKAAFKIVMGALGRKELEERKHG